MANLYTHQGENTRKTYLFMFGFLLLVVGLGYALSYYLGNPVVLYIAIVVSFGMNFGAYWWSDKLALSMSGAKPVAREESQELYRMVENLCITAGLPLPRIHIMVAPQINAFATGRDPEHAAIAVTTGAMEKLSKVELEGVIAHELSHIGNRDILIASVVVVLAGVVAMVADLGLRMSFFGGRSRNNEGGGGLGLVIALVAMIVAPIAATIIRLAVSRQREYLADASGVMLTRYPDGLASALEKIRQDSTPMPRTHTA